MLTFINMKRTFINSVRSKSHHCKPLNKLAPTVVCQTELMSQSLVTLATLNLS